MKEVKNIFDELFEKYPDLHSVKNDIHVSFEMICNCFDRGGKLLVCGNGGSAADGEHIAGELMKGFLLKRPLSENERSLFENISNGEYISKNLQGALPVISLSAHSALLTAFSNDVAPDMVFAQQVWAYAKDSPDLLLALSTSGESENVINAVLTAKALKVATIGITGDFASRISNNCDACIKLPREKTHEIQELTLPVYHALCAMAEAAFFGNR